MMAEIEVAKKLMWRMVFNQPAIFLFV